MTLLLSWQEFATTIGDLLHFRLFEIKQTPITPASLLMFIVFILAFLISSKVFNRQVLKRILDRFDIERGAQYNMLRISQYIIMVIGALLAFQFVGIDLSGLAVIFGLLSVGIGFGLQNVTSNFMAGLILLFERPINIGDRVTVGDTEGDVKSIRMRATTIQTLNNISIIVPNSEFISSQVINWSHGDPKIRLDMNVGVSYNSDLDIVLKALYEVGDENPKVLRNPKPKVLFREFGDSSWNLQLRVWIAHPRGNYEIQSDINMAIVRKFRQYGVEIPFPQRDLHVRSPLPVPFNSDPRKDDDEAA